MLVDCKIEGKYNEKGTKSISKIALSPYFLRIILFCYMIISSPLLSKKWYSDKL